MKPKKRYFRCVSCGKRSWQFSLRYKKTGPWCNSCLKRVNDNIEKKKKEKEKKDDFYAQLLLKRGMKKEYYHYKKLKNKISVDNFV